MVKKIKKVAIIGSGTMGGGIAALLANVGIKTILLDVVPSGVSFNKSNLKNSIVKSGLDKVIMSNPPLLVHKKNAEYIQIGNLEDDFDKISDCDWIIEVVVENLDIKRDLFKRIELIRKVGTIVSTNTSGIPLKSISNGFSLEFRQHFLGTHFFNPVRYMRLLEIIPGQDTLSEILKFVSDFGEKIFGKGIVLAKDTPNFIANRIGIHGISTIMHLMLENKFSIPEVDTLFGTSLGRPKTGIFKTSDIVGLDVLLNVSQNMYELAIKDKERDSFLLPSFVKEMVERKMLGKKTQAGFYKTEFNSKWEKIITVINPATIEYVDYKKPLFDCLEKSKKIKKLSEKIKFIVYSNDRAGKFVWKAIISNFIYAVNKIPEISDNIVEIDNAMKWGFNFELGIFEMWDVIGIRESVKKMREDNISIPNKINKMIINNKTSFYKRIDGILNFYDFKTEEYIEIPISNKSIFINDLKNKNMTLKSCLSASLLDLNDGIFCLEFHTKMNIINNEIIDFMEECIDYVDKEGLGLVISNQNWGTPSVFSAGGDLAFMSNLAKSGKYSEIDLFLNKAQTIMQKIKYSNIPVIVAPHGLTLGGGCEICLGVSDKIVAHSDLYIGLVEVGAGLIPAGGGCLNLWKKIINSIPKTIKDIDLAKFFVPAFMMIATARVFMSAEEAKFEGILNKCDRIIFNRDNLIIEAKKELIKILEDGYFSPLKRQIQVLGDAAMGMVNAEIFNMQSSKFITEYDAYLAKKIAFVMSGGDVRSNSFVDEEVILNLEREAFVELWKEKKTVDRANHILATGKPLRN